MLGGLVVWGIARAHRAISSKLVAAKVKHSAPPNCPANARAPVGKSEHPAGAWFFTKEGTCVFVRIDWADTKPASAAPVHLKGYPDFLEIG